eukprot:TRINITY_DN62970_c0_g1_i1.p1 TRINITY_DN62970_c0_g1~~TRINITY_DN62970_c0_g1_i1.p1  ORF type:complete len:484 (-),score=137.66 TRINITY_DN62970_c0_g1_i1:45-1379(-)
MGKKAKKDPNAPTLIPEDTFVRAKKLFELKVAVKQPKGEFTPEEWCIPPAFHTLPEFKQTIQFWQQCAIVQHDERGMKVPSRMKTLADPSKCEKKPHPRKEIQDLFKYLKSLNKQATKRTGQFLKQLEKKEAKETKRETLLKQIKDVDEQMNEELRSSRKFVDRRQLFEKKYMIGSKLGAEGTGPRKNALILIEQSDVQAAYVDETKDEILKFINNVIEPETETFNLAMFSGSAVTTWCPQFQNKADPKKGLADALKWMNKQFSAKSCAAQAFPPDWVAAINKFTAEGVLIPWRIYICCSRSPEGTNKEIVDLVANLRETLDSPAKGEPVLPIHIVAFDPTIDGNDDEKAFFTDVAGPNGQFLIDTSQEDLLALDKMLKAVQVKRKQLDKLNKKLDKMEDLSERVAEDRSLLQMQIALNNMLSNDLELADWALKNEEVPPEPEI